LSQADWYDLIFQITRGAIYEVVRDAGGVGNFFRVLLSSVDLQPGTPGWRTFKRALDESFRDWLSRDDAYEVSSRMDLVRVFLPPSGYESVLSLLRPASVIDHLSRLWSVNEEKHGDVSNLLVSSTSALMAYYPYRPRHATAHYKIVTDCLHGVVHHNPRSYAAASACGYLLAHDEMDLSDPVLAEVLSSEAKNIGAILARVSFIEKRRYREELLAKLYKLAVRAGARQAMVDQMKGLRLSLSYLPKGELGFLDSRDPAPSTSEAMAEYGNNNLLKAIDDALGSWRGEQNDRA
jgi:hypothetical protein